MPSARINIKAHPEHGFSLLELLLVVVLMAAILGVAASGYTSLIQATALTTGADMINDALNEARQNAVTQNTTVEVRIYALPLQPGSSPVYGTLQLHWLKSDGTTPPINRPLTLPSSVAIDATFQHSSLIGANHETATPDATDTRINSDTRVLHFLPDGSTDLNPSTKWFLTVRAVAQSDPARFPANWACVELDPATGRTQIYRP